MARIAGFDQFAQSVGHEASSIPLLALLVCMRGYPCRETPTRNMTERHQEKRKPI